jgi:hypothetical protein
MPSQSRKASTLKSHARGTLLYPSKAQQRGASCTSPSRLLTCQAPKSYLCTAPQYSRLSSAARENLSAPGNDSANDLNRGSATTSKKPFWLLVTPGFERSNSGEMGRPAARSASPCRKNSSSSAATQRRWTSRLSAMWPRSAHLNATYYRIARSHGYRCPCSDSYSLNIMLLFCNSRVSIVIVSMRAS